MTTQISRDGIEWQSSGQGFPILRAGVPTAYRLWGPDADGKWAITAPNPGWATERGVASWLKKPVDVLRACIADHAARRSIEGSAQ